MRQGALFRSLRVLALAGALGSTSGCGGPSWQEFTSQDGGFRVLMRGDVHYEKRELVTPIGQVPAHMYSIELRDSVFGVGYADYPPQLVRSMTPRRLFMAVRDTWVRRIEGRLQGDGRELRLEGGHPGMEIVAWGTVGSRPAYLKGRFYLVGNRLYQLVVFGNRDSMPIAEINRFLGSFRVLPPREVGTFTISPAPEKPPPPMPFETLKPTP